MRNLVLIAALGAVLAGCGNAPAPVDPALQARAVAAITGSFGAPNAVRLQHAWPGRYGEDLRFVCGRIDAPAGLPSGRASLRFFYEDRFHNSQVEYHELVVADRTGGTLLLAENRQLFDRIWATSCAAQDPERSWWARTFG